MYCLRKLSKQFKNISTVNTYIPRKDGSQKAWGEKSGARDSLRERNRRIYERYSAGADVGELCSEFYLSEQSIRRIISQEKKRA